MASAALPFAPGLAGPFVLDDHVNLAPVWHWLQGSASAWDTATGNRSGPTGRPLAYLTLMANAAIGGPSTFGFKLVNVLLHVASTLLVHRLLRAVITRVAPQTHAWVATLLACAWAAHPLHVSTVLYVVQRMTTLAALAQLAAVLVYFEGRRLLEHDPPRARRLLFMAFPALSIAGLLAKETALVAPLLCAVVEFILFNRPRPREVRVFFLVFLWIPLALGIAWALASDRFGSSYLTREFTFVERVLAEPRVLLDYARHVLVPFDFALYRDGFPSRAGIATTAWATGAWLALLVAALAMRHRKPLFAFGVCWFLAAHALEAGPFALELYFEHRNYLALLGLLVAVWTWLPTPRSATWRIASAAAVVLLAACTTVRAYQWGDIDRLQAHEGPPAGETSRRLQVDRAIRALERGDEAARRDALAVLAQGSAGDRAAAAAWTVIFACDVDGRVEAAQLEQLRANPPAVLTHNHLSWLGIVVARANAAKCPQLGPAQASEIVDAWETGTRQPLSRPAMRRLAALRASFTRAGE